MGINMVCYWEWGQSPTWQSRFLISTEIATSSVKNRLIVMTVFSLFLFLKQFGMRTSSDKWNSSFYSR